MNRMVCTFSNLKERGPAVSKRLIPSLALGLERGTLQRIVAMSPTCVTSTCAVLDAGHEDSEVKGHLRGVSIPPSPSRQATTQLDAGRRNDCVEKSSTTEVSPQCHRRTGGHQTEVCDMAGLDAEDVVNAFSRHLKGATEASNISGRSTKREKRNKFDDKYGHRRLRVDHLLLHKPIPADSILQAVTSARGALAMFPEDQEEEVVDEGRSETFKSWEGMQGEFRQRYESRIIQELGLSSRLHPLRPESGVRDAFLSGCRSGGEFPLMAYHGTSEANVSSISSRGLLIPGHKGVAVAHGSAHGVGIYTAKEGHSSLSKSFCDSDKMFVCAVNDAAPPEVAPACRKAQSTVVRRQHRQHHKPQQQHTIVKQTMGRFVVHKESKVVRHVGGAMVVFEESAVVPLFLASDTFGQSAVSVADCWSTGNPNGASSCDRAGRRQIFVQESAVVVWVPPEPEHDRHGTRVKRTLENKRKKKERQNLREQRYSNIGSEERLSV